MMWGYDKERKDLWSNNWFIKYKKLVYYVFPGSWGKGNRNAAVEISNLETHSGTSMWGGLEHDYSEVRFLMQEERNNESAWQRDRLALGIRYGGRTWEKWKPGFEVSSSNRGISEPHSWLFDTENKLLGVKGLASLTSRLYDVRSEGKWIKSTVEGLSLACNFSTTSQDSLMESKSEVLQGWIVKSWWGK